MMASDLFNDHGIIHDKLLSISPKEVHGLLPGGLIIVDIRDRDYLAFKSFDVAKGSLLHLPPESFDEQLPHLDRQAYYVIADSSGVHSRGYAIKMIDYGFERIACMSGGFVEWERDGLPVRVDVKERLSGACACQLRPRESD